MLFQEEMLTLLLPLYNQMFVTAQILFFEYMRNCAPENLRESVNNKREKALTMAFKTFDFDEMF